MFKKFCLFLAVTLILASSGISQEVVVSKSAEGGNPSIYFKGITGNSEFSSKVGSNLKNCGWFDLAPTPAADYTAEGVVSGNSATIYVKDASGTVKVSFTTALPAGKNSQTADSAVDFIMKKFFDRQICSSKIAFSGEVRSGIKEIYYCDFDGSNIVKATSNNTLSVEPDWFPGKASIIYTMYTKMHTDIVEYEVMSKRSRRLVQFPGLNSCASISPNGRYMAIILSKDGQVELYIKEIETKGTRRLTTGKSVEASPCWSPDGNKLCYVSDSGGRPNLYVVSAAGGTPVKLQTQGSESVTPSWSKDNKIVYSAKMGRSYTIAMLDLAGKGTGGVLVSAAGDWENPSWAPDNRQIVCSRTIGGKSTLFVIDTETKKMRQLFNSPSSLSFPAWSNLLKQ